MIKYLKYEDRKVQESEVLLKGMWIHISPPFDQDKLISLANQFDIPLDYLTDSLDIDERSRYEVEDDVRLIVVNSPIINQDNSDNEAFYITAPVGIVLTTDHIITVSALDNPVINKFIEGRVRNFKPEDQQLFVLQVFEQIVLRYLACLKELNSRRNLIERELYDSSRNAELKQLLRIEKSLVYFVNSLSSNELLKMKMKRTDFLKLSNDEDKIDLFEDIIIDNSQALEMANVHTNILSGTMEAYASIVSNNLNVFIQRLTVVTIILMVPTLVASFYGMNVPLPFGHGDSPLAFLEIILVSIVTSLLLVWFFRRKNVF